MVRSSALVWSCLEYHSIVPTFLSSIFLTTFLLLFSCLLLPLATPLLFSCERNPVWDTHLVHGTSRSLQSILDRGETD